MKTKNIFVFIEQREGAVVPVSYELLSEARRSVTDKIGDPDYKVVGVLLGKGVSALADEAAARGADKVILCDHDKLKNYSTQYYADALTQVIEAYKPDAMLIGATVLGRDLAPRVAARVETGLTADATVLDVSVENPDEPLLLVTRPAFGGNLFATIVCPKTRPQMATIRPNVFEIKDAPSGHKGTVEPFAVTLDGKQMISIEGVLKKETLGVDITKAKVLLSVGRGMMKHMDLCQEVADAIGATLSCSRAVVDEGFAPKDRQVGQTGKTVRPQVYIACGISGAAQHVAGMEKSECIIAINTDPQAAIFSIANVGLVGDAKAILQELKTKLAK